MVGVEFEDSLGTRRNRLTGLSEHSFELGTDVVFRPDQAGGGFLEARGEANLPHRILEMFPDRFEQGLEILGPLFEVFPAFFLLGVVPEVRRSGGDRFQRFFLVFLQELNQQFVDRVVEVEDLVPPGLEGLEMRRTLDDLHRGPRQVEDRVLGYLHSGNVFGERRQFFRVGGRSEEQEVLQLPAFLGAPGDTLLEDPAEGVPELQVVLELVPFHPIERLEDSRSQEPPDVGDVAILLQRFSRNVEGQVGRVDDAPDEPEPRRQDLLAPVHDHHGLGVELEAPGRRTETEIEGRSRGDEEQGPVLDPTLGPEGNGLQRSRPVVRDVPVEIRVLLVRDLGLRPGPDRLHRVESPVLDDGLRFAVGLRGSVLVAFVLRALDRADDGIVDEVRIPLDDVLEDVAVGVVADSRFLVDRLEMKRYRRAAAIAPGLGNVEPALADRLPERRLVLTGLPGDDGDLVGDHENRIKTDAELADQRRQNFAVTLGSRLLQQLPGTGLSDRSQVLDHFFPAHSDTGILDRQGPVLPVRYDPDLVDVILGNDIGTGQPLEAQAVQGVGGVGDQFPEKDIFGRIERVDDEVEQPGCFRLKFESLGCRCHRSSMMVFPDLAWRGGCNVGKIGAGGKGFGAGPVHWVRGVAGDSFRRLPDTVAFRRRLRRHWWPWERSYCSDRIR